MTVIIKLDTGDTYRLDRRWRAADVRVLVDEHRGGKEFVAFPDDATPSQTIYLDPNHVVAIYDDGYTY